MLWKQAKVLSEEQLHRLLTYAISSRHPVRNKAIVLLSFKAGLRAGEISQLKWEMVTDPSGTISSTIELRSHIAKNASGRRIPVHPDLRRCLVELGRECADGEFVSERSGPMLPVSIVHWFARAYRAIGVVGCSSHSGRRTFITRAAKTVHKAGGSLRDVHLLAGHRSIQTTQRYIDGDTEAQHRLVALL